MKHGLRRANAIVFFLLALVLIVTGAAWGIRAFRYIDMLAMTHATHQELLLQIHEAIYLTMLCTGMVLGGIGVLLVLLLQLLRNTRRFQKEAETLREKNEALEAVYRQTRRLAHHQRLETIGTLTASIAHEFNNLLTPIMGYSMMALEKLTPEEEELYDHLLEIYNSSRKAKEIISRLNDLARKNTDSSFREVSPDDLIHKTLSVANPAKPENVEVQLDLNCWDQRIRANEIQISQLLLNLILNGFHAMEDGGGVLTIRTSYAEDSVQIQIQDTGCGIPEENKHRIFEPFFTTKDHNKGTGLGLAIAAQVVEDHRGRIRVESTEGQGSTFTVSLPRTAKLEE